MKQESKKDIIRRLTEGLNRQQRSVPQLPAMARARHISVLGAKKDPKHPFSGYMVGADESVEPGKKRIGPNMSDPYEQGWFAGFNDQNPYAAGTPEHSQWQAGQDEKQAQPNHYDESALSEFAPGPERDNDDDGDFNYDRGDDKINTAANAIVKLLKSRQPVYFQLPDGRVSQIRKISPPNVSPVRQDADGNIIGIAAFDIVSKSSGGRNYLDQVAIQPDMYGIVPVLGKKIVMQVADQNLPPHLKRMRDTDDDLSESDKSVEQTSRVAASPFNNDHSELDQFVKEEYNRDPDDINEESGAVVAHGYAYNRQDQRVAWTREFASEAEATEWARRRNATVLSIVPKPVNENNPAAAWPEFGTAKTYESQLAEAKQRLAEAESRYVLYFNGKPASHYATKAEAERVADSIKAKNPTVKIEIKNEMREQGVAEGIGDEDGENKDYALALAQYGMKVLQGMEKICQQIDALPEPKKSNLLGKLTDVEFAQSGELVQYVIDKLGLKIDDFMEFQDAWEEEDGEPFYLWINEWLAGRWDEFVAPWKKFTMKVLQGRGLGPTLHEAGVSEGAKVDRMVQHIKSSEKKAGKSAKDAENIAWATANKRGMLDNKNKKKVSEAERNEMDTPAVQAALKKMSDRHKDEKWSKEQLAALGKRLAAQDKKPVKETKMSTDIRAKNRAVVKKLQDDGVKEGDIVKTPTGLIHRAKGKYGGGEEPFNPRNPGKYAMDLTSVNKALVKSLDAGLGITYKNQGTNGVKVDEDITQEDIITKLKAKLGDYLSDLGQQIKKDPALQDKLSAETPGDQVGPAVKTVTTDDGHEISIHGNEDDGFRISIKNKHTPSKFDSLDEAVMACEMYCAHRRRQALNADYVDEA